LAIPEKGISNRILNFRGRAVKARLPESEIEEISKRIAMKDKMIGVSYFRHGDCSDGGFINTYFPDGTISDEAFKLLYPMSGVKQYDRPRSRRGMLCIKDPSKL